MNKNTGMDGKGVNYSSSCRKYPLRREREEANGYLLKYFMSFNGIGGWMFRRRTK
jgi:hypothetical protein